MKILHLRFANLNSLYGEWSIDFSAPEYSANGIFALTGPTGAGKSTILDAICLALYGATPRLGRITKSSNEIMSRRTGTCFAEVDFATEGGMYRCHWGQHRARNNASGDLQNPRHEISRIADDNQGMLLETHLRRVVAMVEEKTGMDFERFTRSMLLAQGGFDTFLRADVEQKSALLEQITGTEIYTDISRRVHERQRSEREALKVLEAQISGIQVLEPEQKKAIEAEIGTERTHEQKRNQELDSAHKALLWCRNITTLEQELENLTQEQSVLEKDVAVFEPERERLEHARQAAELEGAYATLDAVRRQQRAEEEELKECCTRIPQLEDEVTRTQTRLKQAQQRYAAAKQESHKGMQQIQQVRILDQQLRDKLHSVNTLQAAYEAEQKQFQAMKEERNAAHQQADKLRGSLVEVEKSVEENQHVASLVPELAGIKAQLENLEYLHREMHERERDTHSAAREYTRTIQAHKEQAQQLEQEREQVRDAERQIENKRHTLQQVLEGRKLAEYRREKDGLLRELAYLQRIEALEDQRAHLQDGKPCPLCGAIEHPYAVGNIPLKDKTQERIEELDTLIERAEGLEHTLESMHTKLEKARTNLTRAETEVATLEHACVRAREHRKEREHALMQLRRHCATVEEPLRTRVEEFGEPFDSAAPQRSVTHLSRRVEAWQKLEREQIELSTSLVRASGEVERLNAVLETRLRALEQKRAELETARTAHAQLQEQRHTLFGDRNPAEAERCMQEKVEACEQEQQEAQNRVHNVQQRLSEVRTRSQTLTRQLEQRRNELERLQYQFSSRCAAAGFATEAAFYAARLESEVRRRLEKKNDDLHQRRLELHTRMQDRSTRLKQERALKLTTASSAELEEQEAQLKIELEGLRAHIAGLKHQVQEHDAAQKRIRAQESAIRTQREECKKWERLHALIGSADGKKFRNFAQGLTFDLMVNHANAQLSRMTERYLLVRDTEQPLELNVVDNYQAGEVRSTRNLSGGESFIVSLTLALGLSNMASRNIRIDSLFLDEGFGTLDEETLETALEALAGLHQEGKLIGIISHVGGLKERIRTRIKVKPGSAGKSRLTGPGVSGE